MGLKLPLVSTASLDWLFCFKSSPFAATDFREGKETEGLMTMSKMVNKHKNNRAL